MMVMECYALVRDGECVQVVCGDRSILDCIEHGVTAHPIDSLCDADELYMSDGNVVRRPNAPGPNYIWNKLDKRWEHSVAAERCIVMSRRQMLLSNSDWTQLPDVPISTKAAWAVYRQALRDITDQPGYPLDVTWPTPPN